MKHRRKRIIDTRPWDSLTEDEKILRLRIPKDKRPYKRKVNQLHKQIPGGGLFLGCNGHPCVCTQKGISKQDLWGTYVDGQSIIDGSGISCSLLHCHPEPLLPAEADEIIKNWENKERLQELYKQIEIRVRGYAFT